MSGNHTPPGHPEAPAAVGAPGPVESAHASSSVEESGVADLAAASASGGSELETIASDIPWAVSELESRLQRATDDQAVIQEIARALAVGELSDEGAMGALVDQAIAGMPHHLLTQAQRRELRRELLRLMYEDPTISDMAGRVGLPTHFALQDGAGRSEHPAAPVGRDEDRE